MAKDVEIQYLNGDLIIYAKVDRLTENASVLRLESGGERGYKHIVSIPYTSIKHWIETEVAPGICMVTWSTKGWPYTSRCTLPADHGGTCHRARDGKTIER
jgi:hypothetical protein